MKSNNHGITLVELIIAVAITSLVLTGAYYLLSFSMRSYRFTEAKFVAEQDARNAVMSMKADIRQANAELYDGIWHKAIELSDAGMTATIYTDTDGDGTVDMVRYKLEDKQLKRGEAAPGSNPAQWTVVANRVYNKLPENKIFTMEGKRLKINLILADENDALEEEPVRVRTSITVRSKGAME